MRVPPTGTLHREHRSRSPRETFALGLALGEEILRSPRLGRSGAALALAGDLGSGKTTFTKGLAAGLGVRQHDRVTSPTFVIRQEYLGALRILHYDVYRLSGPAELLALGFEEDLAPGNVVVLEWSDRVEAAIPEEALRIEFRHGGGPRFDNPGDNPGGDPGDGDRGIRTLDFAGPSDLWEAPIVRAIERAAEDGPPDSR